MRRWLALMALISAAACSPLFGGGPATSMQTPTVASAVGEAVIPAGTSTFTPGPFVLDLTPFGTATPLATLVLPTPVAGIVLDQAWDGLPTYPAESRPDFYYRVLYDPVSWAFTTDQFGATVLAHRSVSGCVMSPAAARGMPPNARVDHEVRLIGTAMFQVDSASVNGVVQFVNYTGGDGVIYTSFEVNVDEQADLCLPAAELVLQTLRSVPASEATPAAGG